MSQRSAALGSEPFPGSNDQLRGAAAGSRRWLLLGAATLAAATDAIYLLLIGAESDRSPFDVPGFERFEQLFRDQLPSPYTPRVILFASLIGAAAVGIAVASFLIGSARIAFGSFGIWTLFALGLLGVMTIGIPLLVAGGLALAGLLPALGGGRAYAAAGIAGVAALAAVTLMMTFT